MTTPTLSPKKNMKLHSGHVEVAVANLINYRVNTIVPNVSWGLGLNHECDMLVLDSKNRFTEIEIKVTGSDLKADFNKGHGHKSKYISRLVYAMPDYVYEKYGHIIPAGFGIITVSDTSLDYHEYAHLEASWVKIPKHNKDIQPLTDKMINKFMSLGCMRIWSLKSHNNRLIKKAKELTPNIA